MREGVLKITKYGLALFFIGTVSGCAAEKSKTVSAKSLQPQPVPVAQEPPKERVKGFRDLTDLTDAFCKKLLEEVGPKKVYLEREKIMDMTTKDISKLSGYLEQEIDYSCGQQGFTMVTDIGDQDYLLSAFYSLRSRELRVSFKYKAGMQSHKSLNYSIARSAIPEDSFSNPLKYKAKKLARTIAKGQKGKTIYVKPVVDGNTRHVTEFSRSFAARLETEIVSEHRGVKVVDYQADRPVAATRAIRKTKKNTSLSNSDAAATGADASLEGKYYVQGDSVDVHLTLKNHTDNSLINAASITIDSSFINSKLKDDKLETMAVIADTKNELPQEMIKLSTTKGSDYPIYYDGDRIVFTIQVREPLYVYLYTFDPAGNVELLYPYDNKEHVRLTPGGGKVYTIPTASDDYEMVVAAPYGVEGLKLFACQRRVPSPSISLLSTERRTRAIKKQRKQQQQSIASSGRVLHPNDLVNYYRGQANRMGVELFEQSFALQTRRE